MFPNPTTLPMQAKINSTLFVQVSLISLGFPSLVLGLTIRGSSHTTFLFPILLV